jgi:hypothetical protein
LYILLFYDDTKKNLHLLNNILSFFTVLNYLLKTTS